MIELNRLFLDAYVLVNKFLQKNHITYYPTSVGSGYKELFKRDIFACLSFYTSNKGQYYLYFNAAYNSDINRMVFTSISVVSRDALNRKVPNLALKTHIENTEDIQAFLESLKDML